jgi:hypothetical protein
MGQILLASDPKPLAERFGPGCFYRLPADEDWKRL